MANALNDELSNTLANELHSRPFVDLHAPENVSFLAVLSGEEETTAEREHLAQLCARHDVAMPQARAKHFLANFGTFRLKWEQHTEFTTYTFFHQSKSPQPFSETAVSRVPADWLEALPGHRVVAAHVALLSREQDELSFDDLSRFFATESICQGLMMGGAAVVTADFRVHADGFVRFLVNDRSLYPREAGRLVQRVLEVETYKDMALLALPLAREESPKLGRIDRALAELTARMKTPGALENERELLDQLVSLSTEIEESIAATSYRFSAASAYNSLVSERTDELKEEDVSDYSTLHSFVERRFAPAMRTCESVAARQSTLSERATRAADLLRTRVDIKVASQNSDLLASVDRRARLQLRLQQTIEGLSVAAITYYVVSLIGFSLAGVGAAGYNVDVDLYQGGSVPLVALAVWWGVHQIQKRIHNDV